MSREYSDTPFITRLFNRIAVRELSGEWKSEVAQTIIDDLNVDRGFRIQMGLSAVIASLGLMINAAPVVIGAMLIAPIMRPIQAVSFATATWHKWLFFKALWILLLSILGSIVGAIGISLIIPFDQVTSEILLRTEPTLVDMWIAFASWLIAFLAFKYDKLESSLAWVAMAASLVPPICVIWIGIWFNQWSIAWWSTLLVLTNLVAIIFAGIILFYVYGFYPKRKKDISHSMINSLSIFIMLVVLCIPLATSMVGIVQNITTNETISSVLEGSLSDIHPKTELEEFTYKKYDTLVDQNEWMSISASVKVPQEVPITNNQKTEITRRLADTLNMSVDLDLTIIPVASVTLEEITVPTRYETINQLTQEFMTQDYPNVFLLSLNVIGEQSTRVIATFFSDQEIDRSAFKARYLTYLQEHYAAIEWIIINREIETATSLQEEEQQEVTQTIWDSFRNFFFESLLRKVSINEFEDDTTLYITLRISTPLSSQALQQKMERRKEQISTLLWRDVDITLHISSERVEDF